MNYNLGLVISKQFDEIKKTLTGRKYPENLIWFLTERCNLKCGHCFVSHKGRKYRDEITYDQINKILNTSKNSLKKIAFTGGEPLLNKDFENIFISADALPNLKELHVSTNGMFNEKLFSILQKCKNEKIHYHVQSSLDGSEEIHNAIRGNKRSYKGVIELLNMFSEFKKSSNLSLGMSLVMAVSRKNRHIVKETMELVKPFNVPLTLNFVRSSSDSNLDKNEISDFIPIQNDDNGLTAREMKSVIHDWSVLAVKYYGSMVYQLNKIRMNNIVQYQEKGTWMFPCAAGINNAIIFSDGAVSVCETKKPFANLQDFDFDYGKLWKKYYDGKMYTCYCSFDCAIEYSVNKSAKGYWVFAKSLMGL